MPERKNIQTARRLRRDMTDVEKAMWRLLRSRQLDGFKFRRQQPIGPYIVDFVCFSHRLVVEIDGGQQGRKPESRPTRFARVSSKAKVFGFSDSENNEVAENAEGVCERIRDVASASVS